MQAGALLQAVGRKKVLESGFWQVCGRHRAKGEKTSMLVRKIGLVLAALSLTGLFLPLASAQEETPTIEITKGSRQAFPIAIPDFSDPDDETGGLAKLITDVIRNDLTSTGLFALTDPDAYIQKDLDVRVEPRFEDWRIIQSDGLVIGEVGIGRDGQLQLGYRLWNITTGRQYLLDDKPGKVYTAKVDDWRRVAHKVADDIYARLTGGEGYFDSRIVYVAESGPVTARVKRLAIMDADGENLKYLTEGRTQIITPRFSPNEQKIAYMAYEGRLRRARVYLFDLITGRQEVLGSYTGLTFAPRFSPDGKSVILSQARNGNTDLHIIDLATRESRRLTDHPAIDTSPTMSPDGKQITFTSDRGGSPQVYIMNTDGSPLTCPSGGQDTACRISFGRGNYYTPVWSPRGDLIAFTKQRRGKFYIGVIGVDGKGERLLTESYLDEGPTWSPNGRVIAFFREIAAGAGPRLWSIDLTGDNLKEFPTPTDASDPAWSPVLSRQDAAER